MKLKETQAVLKQENIDFLLLVSPDPAITYFTQRKFSQAMMIISPNNARLLITALDQWPRLANVNVSILSRNWEKDLASPAKAIAVNYPHLTVTYLEKLKKIFPQAGFKDYSGILTKLRINKTADELHYLSKACAITCRAYDAALNQLSKRKLNTEQALASFLEQEIRNQNAELAFPTIIASGRNAAIPHHLTGNYRLKRGFLIVDFGASYKNYCADMTRTIFLGKPASAEISRYKLLLAAQQSAISQLTEKKPFLELDQRVKKMLGPLSTKFIHSLGHGIGLEVHEPPVFSSKAAKVEKNQVFTIEPGIYFKGKYGLRIEDTVAFINKPKILTKACKELVAIP